MTILVVPFVFVAHQRKGLPVFLILESQSYHDFQSLMHHFDKIQYVLVDLYNCLSLVLDLVEQVLQTLVGQTLVCFETLPSYLHFLLVVLN